MKAILFRYYYWIAFIACLLAISLRFCEIPDYDWRSVITILGGVLGFVYFVQKQKLEEMHLFKDLFAEFNERYDELNEDLNQILRGDDNKKLTTQDIDTLDDYFNLCGEEYFFYKQEYIPSKVWRTWCNGMKYFLDNKRVREYWLREEKTNSYYDLTFSIILKSAG
jgi:hypothetical protein